MGTSTVALPGVLKLDPVVTTLVGIIELWLCFAILGLMLGLGVLASRGAIIMLE